MRRQMTQYEFQAAINRTQSREELERLVSDVNTGQIQIVNDAGQPMKGSITIGVQRVVQSTSRTGKPSRRQRQRKLLTRQPEEADTKNRSHRPMGTGNG